MTERVLRRVDLARDEVDRFCRTDPDPWLTRSVIASQPHH